MGQKEFYSPISADTDQIKTNTEDIQTATNQIQTSVNEIQNTDLSNVNQKIGVAGTATDTLFLLLETLRGTDIPQLQNDVSTVNSNVDSIKNTDLPNLESNVLGAQGLSNTQVKDNVKSHVTSESTTIQNQINTRSNSIDTEIDSLKISSRNLKNDLKSNIESVGGSVTGVTSSGDPSKSGLMNGISGLRAFESGSASKQGSGAYTIAERTFSISVGFQPSVIFLRCNGTEYDGYDFIENGSYTDYLNMQFFRSFNNQNFKMATLQSDTSSRDDQFKLLDITITSNGFEYVAPVNISSSVNTTIQWVALA